MKPEYRSTGHGKRLEQILIDKINSLIRDAGDKFTEEFANVAICRIIDTMCGFRGRPPMISINLRRIKKIYELMEKKRW